ncbi:hypothetical protein D9M71_503430 [compost metagenome]
MLAIARLPGLADQSVDALLLRRERQEGRFVQQPGEIDRAFADEVDLDAVQLADGLLAPEGHDLERDWRTLDVQIEVGSVGRVEHPLSSCRAKTHRPGEPDRCARCLAWVMRR